MSQKFSLNEESGYNKLLSYYEENKHNKDWKQWLTFDKTLKPGKQGLVGLMKLNNGDGKYVFKLSQYINYLVEHESTIMKGLNELSSFCPHFCKSIGTITCNTDPERRKEGNPFEDGGDYSVEKDVLLCEFINKSCKFSNYIRSESVDEEILYSTIKQVLLAIAIAQNKKQFAHYDLHSYNIMMKKCNKDAVFLYVLDDGNQFCVPTHGHYPVIIDFGFSYINNMENGPLWGSMAHTGVGFMSDRFDWVADPKLFLVTVSGEIKEKRYSAKSKKLRRIVKNIFNPLSIDWLSGWDKHESGATDYVLHILEEYNKTSNFFKKYDHYAIDLIQSLIVLPLKKRDYNDIGTIYQAFLKEWLKIENEISNAFYNLYILKCMVDSARKLRSKYIVKNTKTKAVKDFGISVYEIIDKVVKYCTPKNINFEIMLCSLLVFSDCVEGVLYDIMNNKMTSKNKSYKKLPLQSVEQIYGAITTNIPDTYQYNENTTVFVYDCIKKETSVFNIPEEYIDIINDTHHLCHGSVLYDIYNKTDLK
jgi:hypothetical protein